MRPSMIPITTTLATILLAYLCLTQIDLAVAQQCGRQAGYISCPDSICCSRWGWCGTSEEFCGTGCQSDCLMCGSKRGGLTCADGRCCSPYGYCGSGSYFCCGGCQSNCRCSASTSTYTILKYLMDYQNTTATLS